jgi:hypothetical protein
MAGADYYGNGFDANNTQGHAPGQQHGPAPLATAQDNAAMMGAFGAPPGLSKEQMLAALGTLAQVAFTGLGQGSGTQGPVD